MKKRNGSNSEIQGQRGGWECAHEEGASNGSVVMSDSNHSMTCSTKTSTWAF